MFSIKRMISLGLMLLTLSTLLAFTTGVASAQTTQASASCSYSSCNYKSPVSTGCQNTAVIEHYDSGTIDNGIGITIQLQFSTACHAAWGRVVFSRTLPSGYFGYATLDYTNFSAEVTCSDAGGDGNVLPGQSVCYTPMLSDGPTQSTAAFGWYCGFSGCNAPVSTKPF